MKINGSQIVIECLIEQGVDTVFGYPGGNILNIYDALYKNSDRITHILTAHEQLLPMRQTVTHVLQVVLEFAWQQAVLELQTL